MSRRVQPSGIERHFGDGEIIVSKTDPRGIITYTNDVLQRVSGYAEEEPIGYRPRDSTTSVLVQVLDRHLDAFR